MGRLQSSTLTAHDRLGFTNNNHNSSATGLINNTGGRNPSVSVARPPRSGTSEVATKFLNSQLVSVVSRDRTLNSSFKYFMNKVTCGKLWNSKEVKLLQKGIDSVQQDLNVFVILDKIKEMEKMKKLLLSKEQQTLFNFFPKPLIQLESTKALLTPMQLLKKEEEAKKHFDKAKKDSKNVQFSFRAFRTILKAVQKFKQGRQNTPLSHY